MASSRMHLIGAYEGGAGAGTSTSASSNRDILR